MLDQLPEGDASDPRWSEDPLPDLGLVDFRGATLVPKPLIWPFHPGLAAFLGAQYVGPFCFMRVDGVLVTVV